MKPSDIYTFVTSIACLLIQKICQGVFTHGFTHGFTHCNLAKKRNFNVQHFMSFNPFEQIQLLGHYKL